MKRKIITLLALSTTLALSAQIKLEASNIDDIIATMTLKEKVYFVLGVGDEGVWRHYRTKPALILRGQACATYGIPRLGIPNTVLTDGPAGLRIDTIQTGVNHRTYCTAFPTATALASTWNKELVYQVGDAIGEETFRYGSDMLLGPAMNIQRHPLTGRNFEYYSEDSLLSGYMAANEMNGAATKGVYPYMKHFALNDQETNRCSFLLTFASEQTIREGYLKAFELATKGFEGKAMAVMSSFNWIGTVPSCANNELLNNVLRGEWGFVGMVETDYDGSYGYMITDHCIRNGNDLMLGFNSAESNKLTDESATAVLAMRQACKNILYTVANSGYYADGNPATGMTNMTKLFVMIDVILAVVLIVVDTIVIVRWRKKKKQAANE